MKIKFLLSVIALASCSVVAVPAIAQDGNLTQGPMVSHHEMMMQQYINQPQRSLMQHQKIMMQNAPVPMLMPVVIHHAAELKLTSDQHVKLMDDIKVLRQEFPKFIKSMINDNRALRQALLSGEFVNVIKPLEEKVNDDHVKMLSMGVKQVEFLHKLLTPAQWESAVKLSEHPWEK